MYNNSYNNKQAAIKARERIDKILSYIILECPNTESWKEIEWSNGYYWVSNHGRVLSICGK